MRVLGDGLMFDKGLQLPQVKAFVSPRISGEEEVLHSSGRLGRAGNDHGGFSEFDVQAVEGLGRRAADVRAGVGVVNPAVAGAVDAVFFRLVLDRATEVFADGDQRHPLVVGVMNQHGRSGAELEHQGCAGGQFARIRQGDIVDDDQALGLFNRRLQITVNRVTQRRGIAQTDAARSDADKGPAIGEALSFGVGFEGSENSSYVAFRRRVWRAATRK